MPGDYVSRRGESRRGEESERRGEETLRGSSGRSKRRRYSMRTPGATWHPSRCHVIKPSRPLPRHQPLPPTATSAPEHTWRRVKKAALRGKLNQHLAPHCHVSTPSTGTPPHCHVSPEPRQPHCRGTWRRVKRGRLRRPGGRGCRRQQVEVKKAAPLLELATFPQLSLSPPRGLPLRPEM